MGADLAQRPVPGPRRGAVNLVRTDAREVGSLAVLRPPADRFALVVNVSAPEGSDLDYECESYRITLALTKHCTMTATELGTLDDLVETVRRVKPTGVHFSGHGSRASSSSRMTRAAATSYRSAIWSVSCAGASPTDHCRHSSTWPIATAMTRWRWGRPDGGRESRRAAAPGRGDPGGRLQRPDPRGAIDRGRSRAVCRHRRGPHHSVRRLPGPRRAEPAGRSEPIGPGARSNPRAVESMRESHPFAWSQLVLYHRGPDHPLSQPSAGWPAAPRVPRCRTAPSSTWARGESLPPASSAAGPNCTGCAGKCARPAGVCAPGAGRIGQVDAGLPYAERDPPRHGRPLQLLVPGRREGQNARRDRRGSGQPAPEYCRRRFGLAWEDVVQYVNRVAVDDPSRRFTLFLQGMMESVDRLVVYLDNLESLLVGPERTEQADPDAFGQWRTPGFASDLGEPDRIRPRHGQARRGRELPLSERELRQGTHPGRSAAGWGDVSIDGVVSCLAAAVSRVARPAGGPAGRSPAGLEFAPDLIERALDDWEERHGRVWALPTEPTADDVAHEWAEIVGPACPRSRGSWTMPCCSRRSGKMCSTNGPSGCSTA